jgi:glycosyltransferase involved in cell wall biosynthesis
MKILILNYEYPPLGGGAGVVSKYHAEGLALLGHKVTVISTWFEGEKPYDESDNLRIFKLKSKRRYIYKSTPLEWLSWIRKSKKFLSRHLVENSYDFCFAHFALPGGEVARYTWKKFNLPYAIVSHGQDIPWFFPKQMFKYHLITYLWIKTICRNAEKLILLTDAMKQNADRFMGSEKHKNVIIPNGCETKNFFPDYNKREPVLKILFVGRLVSQKDPFTFLKALKLIKEKDISDFKVHILGDGPLKEKMNRYILKNNLDNCVQLKGWVSKEELLKEYQSAHLQVISSMAEAMSIAALESLSAGVYLISTPVSGNTDIITDKINGEFFEFRDARQLTQNIIDFKVGRFKVNYRVPDQSLINFRNKYDWSNIISQLEAIITVKESI